VPQPAPLPEIVDQATLVSILRIESVNLKAVPDDKPTGFFKTKDGKSLPFYTGRRSPQLGDYKFTVLRTLKGDAHEHASIEIPSMIAVGYSAPFDVKSGSVVVAFFQKDGTDWTPQDPLRPFIPLPIGMDITSVPSGTVLHQVEFLISQELKDEAIRPIAVNLLSYSTDPQVLVALAPYIEDPNLRLRDSVLIAFARNRQFGAINRIRDLNRLLSKQNSNARSIEELRSFSGMKEAVPLLNPLLFEDEQFMRVNALDTLSQSKDASILPFLLLTLYDPEPQKANAPEAYAMFAQMPGVKLSVAAGDFALHPDQARKAAWAWWRDELAGKHPHGEDDKDRIVLNEGERHEAKELPQLNEGLFMRSQYTRLAAVEALNKLADGSSVPYLIIALRDPNGDVAYGAHHILARLVPALGPYLPRSTFDTSRDQLAEAGVKWWVKHLQDAEEARLPEFMRTANKIPAK